MIGEESRCILNIKLTVTSFVWALTGVERSWPLEMVSILGAISISWVNLSIRRLHLTTAFKLALRADEHPRFPTYLQVEWGW